MTSLKSQTNVLTDELEQESGVIRLTQRVLDLEDQVSETREREMEATRELQQEKLRSTLQRVDSEGSEEDPDHWNIYKTQLESICQSLQYLILQYQYQLSSGVEGSVNVQSLEKSLKDLLSELKQTQTPLALESDTMDSLTSRPSAQAVNQRCRMAMIRVKTTQIRRTAIWKLAPHWPKRGCRFSWPLIKWNRSLTNVGLTSEWNETEGQASLE
uniref:Uncharacterized protein n=1 Tax=Magallana gigas TaxID=29159 RepID=K1QYU8_MAGGI